jgi:P27 family predicted phage terminase small subunit
MGAQSHLTALPGVDNAAASSAGALGATIISEIPDIPTKLSAKEKKIWTHVTEALLEYGLIHRTDGLTLTVICRTYVDWVDATEELDRYKRDNNNSYITESSNGYRTPHPLYYVARDHKKSLLTWLPEAALTIPSFQKIKGGQLEDKQASLFDDPIANFKSQKAAIGMRIVGKNDASGA